jgi:hypothetical protein
MAAQQVFQMQGLTPAGSGVRVFEPGKLQRDAGQDGV